MKRQRGEAMLVVMVVMMIAMWVWSGRTGMGPMAMTDRGVPQVADMPNAGPQNSTGTPPGEQRAN